MSKDTMTRVLSALVGLVVFFVIVFLSPLFFYIALGAVTLFMLFELLHALKLDFVLILTALIASVAVIHSTLNARYDTLAFIIIAYMSILIIESIFFHKKINFEDIAKTLFATLYVSIFTTFIGRMRYIDEFGIYYLCLIFTSSWMSDTGAYFMGRFFGRRKLAPDISPKKTVAGSIGGVIFSVISCVVLGMVAAFLSNAQPNY